MCGGIRFRSTWSVKNYFQMRLGYKAGGNWCPQLVYLWLSSTIILFFGGFFSVTLLPCWFLKNHLEGSKVKRWGKRFQDVTQKIAPVKESGIGYVLIENCSAKDFQSVHPNFNPAISSGNYLIPNVKVLPVTIFLLEHASPMFTSVLLPPAAAHLQLVQLAKLRVCVKLVFVLSIALPVSSSVKAIFNSSSPNYLPSYADADNPLLLPYLPANFLIFLPAQCTDR